MNDINETKSDFIADQTTPFITYSTAKMIAISLVLCGLCVSAYLSRPHIVVLIIAGLIVIFPTTLLYFRKKFFTYDNLSSISINLEEKLFRFKHKDKMIEFKSNDIAEWSSHEYGTRFISVVEITEITLKNGEKIFAHGGLGDLYHFLRRNKEKLDMPEENISWNYSYLFDHYKDLFSRS